MNEVIQGSEEEKLDPRVLAKIKSELKQRGLKPIDLARGLKYSGAWSSHLMAGDRGLTVNQLIRIAEFLNIHPSALLPDIGVKPDMDVQECIRMIVREEIKKTIESK